MTKISNQYSLTNILTADLANSRLGINNVSPTVALDVTGAGKFSSTITSQVNGSTFGTASATGRALIIQAGSTNQAIMFKNAANGDATLFINGTSTTVDYNFNTYSVGDALVIKNSGNVGIGTSSPRTSASGDNKTLDVKGGIYFGSTNAESCTINNDDSMIFNIDADNSSTSNFFRWATNTKLETGGSELMRLTEAGNLGIGTSTPDQLVSIRKTSAGAETIALALQNIGSTAGTAVSMVFCPHENSSTPEPLAKISGIRMAASGALTDLAFYTFITPGGLIERMRIKSDGELCVGTNTPSYNTTNRGNITINGSASSLLAFQVGGTAKAYAYHDGTNYSIVNNASGSIYMSSNGGGVQLTSGATSWASSSDERLKNINSNIENAVDKLSSLRAVNFSWKSDETQKEVLGLIAQDVDKVFPQVVDKAKLPVDINGKITDETEYLNVRYTELVPVLVKAIQELSAKVSLLENK